MIQAGSPRREHAAREGPRPRASVSRSLSASNSRRAVARVPRAHAAQPLVVRADLPDGAELPAERAARSPRASPRRPRQAPRFPRGSARPRARRAAGRARRRPATAWTPPWPSTDATPIERRNGRRARPLRVVVADDNALLREGIASLLEDAGHEVVGRAGDADDLLLKVRSYTPGHRDRRRAHAARQRRRRARRGGRDPPRRTRRSRCSCSRSTSSRRTCSSSSATTPRASATCSRTACATCASSSTPSSASPTAARRSIPEVVKTPRRRPSPLGARRAHRPRARRALAASPRAARTARSARSSSSARARSSGTCRRSSRSSASRTPRTTTAACSPVLALLGHWQSRRKTARIGRLTAAVAGALLVRAAASEAPARHATEQEPDEPRPGSPRDELRPRRPARRRADGRVLLPPLRGRPGGEAALPRTT